MKLRTLGPAFAYILAFSFATPSYSEVNHPSELDWKQFNNAVVNNLIIPAYGSLASNTKALHQSAQTLCSSLSEESLEISQEKFHLVMDSWQSIQHITFGPVEYSMRHYSMQFWPDKKNHVGKHLGKLISSNDPSLLTEEIFQLSRVSVKGLPAIERILFSDYALTDIKTEPFRCEVLSAISRNVNNIGTALYSEWQNHMRGQFADAKQLDGYFEDDIDAATALLKTMIEPLEVIRDLKLKRPLGSAYGKEKFKRLESWRSQRSLRNIEKNIQSLQGMFSGKDGKSGLSDMLSEQTFQSISKQYAALILAIKNIEQPLEQAIQTEAGYQSTVRIYEAMGKLHQSLEKTASDLGIHLGFNSRDGD